MNIERLRNRLNSMKPLEFVLFCVAWFITVVVGVAIITFVIGMIGVVIFFSVKYIFHVLPDLQASPSTQEIITSLPGAVANGLTGIMKTALLLPLGFLGWQFARIIPNKPVDLYHVQRAIQLIGVPLLLSVIGLSLGWLEGLYFGIAFCLFTPWFLHKGYVKTDKGRVLVEHENWPFPDSPIARYTLGICFFAAGLSTAFS